MSAPAGRGRIVKLYTKIFIGLVLGAVAGVILSLLGLGDWGGYLKPFGDAFINLIMMVVIPLVMASIILGVASLGDVRALGRIGAKTMLFYAVAIVLAVTFGLFVANLFQPGAGMDENKRDNIIKQVVMDKSFMSREEAAAVIVDSVARRQTELLERIGASKNVEERHSLASQLAGEVEASLAESGFKAKRGETPDTITVGDKAYLYIQDLNEPGAKVTLELPVAAREEVKERSVGDILLNMIPRNPVQAMAEGNMLPIIVFSIFFGLALTMIGEDPRTAVVGVLEGINSAMIVLVNIIMSLAPYGVFAIIAAVTAQLGFDFLLSLLRYALVTIGAMAVYMTVFYGAAVLLLTGTSPINFFKAMRPVMLFAFSTCSSNATLPENINACQNKLGVPREVVSFSLPLGATINMDGTAIYQGISAMFIAQVFGMPLSLEQQAMVVLTASLASIGAAGVPGIGMVTLALVLSSVGLPTAGIALVLGVERVLDMFRTVLNVTGDAAGAVIVGSTEGGLKIPDED